MVIPPRKSGSLIASLSKHVKINEACVERLGKHIVEEINSGRLSVSNFSQNEFHPKPKDPWVFEWMFVVDTLNFCFWKNTDESWMVEGQSGYFALCAAINRALQEGTDILNPHFYSKITKEKLLHILRADTGVSVPLLEERVRSLHEVGDSLIRNFNGKFENCVKQANNSAVELLRIITDNFECYCDEAVFKDHHVSFYKRAQILIGDIWACFRNEGLGFFNDIDQLTMFADYRVPQSLLYHGVLEYDDHLMKILSNNSILKNGSVEEVEIRGCSIHAVDLLNDYVKKFIDNNRIVNCILIDHFLWDFRRKHNRQIVERKLPFHKTYSIYY